MIRTKIIKKKLDTYLYCLVMINQTTSQLTRRKKMKKYLFITLACAAACGYYSNTFAAARAGVGGAGVEVDVTGQPDLSEYYYDQEQEPVWVGPGYYHGVWFEDETGFHNWHKSHSNQRDRHDGYHRGSGERHGGRH
jgi:hypothetical protein